jgi:predicted RNase H-like nuclease (RuvC/YqgF family)
MSYFRQFVLLEGLAKAWGTNKSQIPEKKVREIEEMRGLLEHNEELRIALKAEIRRLAKQIQHAHQSCERIQHTANQHPTKRSSISSCYHLQKLRRASLSLWPWPRWQLG